MRRLYQLKDLFPLLQLLLLVLQLVYQASQLRLEALVLLEPLLQSADLLPKLMGICYRPQSTSSLAITHALQCNR